ncbi:MAG: M20/M25/M40 family metallo-hydrolase [Pyrinomonadaceae bacterium]
MIKEGAAAVMIEETPRWRQNWSSAAPSYREIEGVESTAFNLIVLSTAAANAMRQVADDTQIQVAGRLAEPDQRQTHNVIGELRGTDARLSREVVVISAHLDHLGVRGDESGDQIYNGADDDASGVIAVLELARALGTGVRPRRTVYFVLFGSEENGGYGAQYFLDHPPAPLETIVANLEFEMIGRPDPKVALDTLWLTGYERSNLGSTLAARARSIGSGSTPRPKLLSTLGQLRSRPARRCGPHCFQLQFAPGISPTKRRHSSHQLLAHDQSHRLYDWAGAMAG